MNIRSQRLFKTSSNKLSPYDVVFSPVLQEQTLKLRQDLRLTIPEVLQDDHANVTPWCLNHENNPIGGRQSQTLKSVWKQNPLEEEDHWVPLNEHHPQTMIVEIDYDSPQDRNGDPFLASAGCVAHDKKDPSCFSPAIIAETLQAQYPAGYPDVADLAEDDDKSFLPVAEVLWKPSTRKSSPFAKDFEKKMPNMVLLTTKPESWSFTSEDDHPRPESGSVSHNMVFEDQPCAQETESPSIDEVRISLPLDKQPFYVSFPCSRDYLLLHFGIIDESLEWTYGATEPAYNVVTVRTYCYVGVSF